MKKKELRKSGEDEEVYDEREAGVAHDVILDSPHQICVKAEQKGDQTCPGGDNCAIVSRQFAA